MSARTFRGAASAIYRGEANCREVAAWDLSRANRVMRAEHAFLLALRDGTPRARAMAGAGFFSLYDCADDREATFALLARLRAWQRDHGAALAFGPVPPGFEQLGAGVLREGFGRPSALNVFSLPCASRFLSEYGFRLEADHYGYSLDLTGEGLRQIELLARFSERRFAISVAPAPAKAREAARLMSAVFEDIPGEEAFCRLIARLGNYYARDLTLFAYKSGAPVGMLMAFPDGDDIRVACAQIAPAWRNGAALTPLASALAVAARARGARRADVSTVLSSNVASISAVERFGGVRTRVYSQYSIKI